MLGADGLVYQDVAELIEVGRSLNPDIKEVRCALCVVCARRVCGGHVWSAGQFPATPPGTNTQGVPGSPGAQPSRTRVAPFHTLTPPHTHHHSLTRPASRAPMSRATSMTSTWQPWRTAAAAPTGARASRASSSLGRARPRPKPRAGCKQRRRQLAWGVAGAAAGVARAARAKGASSTSQSVRQPGRSFFPAAPPPTFPATPPPFLPPL